MVSLVQKVHVMKTEENRDSEERHRPKGWPIMKAAFTALGHVITESFCIFQSIIEIIIVTSFPFCSEVNHKSYGVSPKVWNEQEHESSDEHQEENQNGANLSFNYKILPPLDSPNKKTIFLDLDETLIHSTSDPPTQRFDFIVRPKVNGVIMNYYVVKRPGVDELLATLAAKFEVVVFTAGMEEYASLILDKLDRKGLISHRLYRDSCKYVNKGRFVRRLNRDSYKYVKGRFVKDLSGLGRDLKKVAIVDDKPYSYSFQPWNGIPIRAFTDDRNDRELVRLAEFLDKCDCFDDMRDAVKCYRKMQKKTSRFSIT